MFKDSTAVAKWNSPDYLNQHLGSFDIPIVKNGVVGTFQDDRMLVSSKTITFFASDVEVICW